MLLIFPENRDLRSKTPLLVSVDFLDDGVQTNHLIKTVYLYSTLNKSTLIARSANSEKKNQN